MNNITIWRYGNTETIYKMKQLYIILFLLAGCITPVSRVSSQSIVLSKDFKLSSPFSEPDGRSDVVKINATDFVTLAKVKGSQTGKSDFTMERYNSDLNAVWAVPLSAENSEDYKDLYFNGKEIVLLSVVHLESEKKTKLEAYGFDPKDGNKLWSKELESFQVGDWDNNMSKGKVKESFIDLVCEHTNQDFVTPFEYKHNINFSPDQTKFVSFVYNYGEANLTANVSVYDNSCNLLKRGKVAIDNNYTNYGIFINNAGKTFMLNANNIGKVNFIQFDMDTKDFILVDLPPTNFAKDDFHVHFHTDEIAFVGNTEVRDGKIFGVMYSKFNFKEKKVEFSIFEDFGVGFKSEVENARKNNKQMKGVEDWLDYDITHFIVNKEEEVLMVLEKRALHADGYPHIGRGTFDKSHKVEFTGHVQAETILMFSFDRNGDLNWRNYILKNQIYPAGDGLNTVSFVLDNSLKDQLRILYASSENMDGSLKALNLLYIDRATGKISKNISLPNDNKLTLVRDYTFFNEDNTLVIVGKKGMLGKASMIIRYKL
jgi:hypothetical protein